MERRKQNTMVTIPAEPANRIVSIVDIETELAALRGGGADINEHLRQLETYHDDLDRFYNGDHHIFKEHKWDAKRAREEEYRRITDSLLRMVGGCIGAKREADNRVVIGIGLGDFSSSLRCMEHSKPFSLTR